MRVSSTKKPLCPCGTGKKFAKCCQPYTSFKAFAPTAEKLMRSRYSAFVTGAVHYLIRTTAPEHQAELTPKQLEQQIAGTRWLGLEILDCQSGAQGDFSGVVEFNASFETAEDRCILHERSNFRYENGQWFYVDGEVEILGSE